MVPACAAEIGDEVEDPVEAVVEGWGEGLPGVLYGFAGFVLCDVGRLLAGTIHVTLSQPIVARFLWTGRSSLSISIW